MKIINFILCGVLFCFYSFGQKIDNPVVLIKTELGNIKVELYKDKAPISVNNFLRYVDSGLYKNTTFYRTVTLNNQQNDIVKIEVIQGGLFEEEKMLPPIKHETTKETGILHKNGTISYARLAPGSASSEFFICIGNQPELDYGGRRNPDRQGFAAFGKVINGMNVVRKIHKQKADGQMLEQPVKIFNITRSN